MLIFFEKKSRMYIRTSYVRTQNFGEKDIFCAMYKKDKKCLVNSYNQASKLCFLTKKGLFSSKLGAHTYNVRIYTQDFFLIFLNFVKYVFRQWVHIHL